MAEYHIGCGIAGIYAGTLNQKNKRRLSDMAKQKRCHRRSYCSRGTIF